MKKIIVILLVITAIITGTVVFLGLRSSGNQTSQNNVTVSPSGEQSDLNQSADGSGDAIYTAADVAEKNSPQNCWIIVNGSVYDVTQYIDRHPGGAKRITDYCGKDATEAFANQGGEGQHSSSARNLLNGFKIGSVAN